MYVCIYTHTYIYMYTHLGFPGGSYGKESAYNTGDMGSIPGLGRSPGGGHSNMTTHSSIPAWRIFMDSGHLEGYSSWSCKDLDTTEQLTHIYIYISFFLLF